MRQIFYGRLTEWSILLVYAKVIIRKDQTRRELGPGLSASVLAELRSGMMPLAYTEGHLQLVKGSDDG